MLQLSSWAIREFVGLLSITQLMSQLTSRQLITHSWTPKVTIFTQRVESIDDFTEFLFSRVNRQESQRK